MQDGWAQRLQRELTEEWQAAADARPMPHNSAWYTDTAWTLLPKTELGSVDFSSSGKALLPHPCVTHRVVWRKAFCGSLGVLP